MKNRITFVILVAVVSALFQSSAALACACCSEDGEYSISFRKAEEYELGEMKRMRLGRTAFLYLSEADGDEIKGIGQPSTTYTTAGSLVGNTWKLSIRSGPNSGVLELLLPEKVLFYNVDIHDGRRSAGGGPLLYKEWRFEGRVNGTGLFKAGITGSTKYFFVLQGRGNGCNNAEDFGNWRLEVTGENAKYAFFGKLGKPD
jgi:hypothetical protein